MTYWLVNKMLSKGDFNFKESISTVTPTRSATSTIMNAGTEDDFSPARTMDMNKIIECWTSDNKNNNDNNNCSGTNSKGSIQISENDLIVHLEHLTQSEHDHFHIHSDVHQASHKQYFQFRVSLVDNVKYVHLYQVNQNQGLRTNVQ
jgi:hypothetical protein